MRGPRVCGIFSIVLLLLVSTTAFTFACAHYHNWWSLFIWLACALAFFTPAVCYNYTDSGEDLAFHDVSQRVDETTFRNCRELGWSMAAVFLLGSYGIPVLAWYNDPPGFHWGGVLIVYGSLTCAVWAYVLWLRIFVFYK